MGESHENLLKVVRHCQESLDKYTENRNESKLLHYLDKLYKLPIKVVHLEQTGVGRTVNGLRKLGGDVGDSAKSLVAKWKEMVVGEQEEEDDEEDEDDEDDDDDDEDGYQTGEEHSSDSDDKDSRDKKVKDTSSSHRKSDSNRTDDYDKVKKKGESSSRKEKDRHEKHNGHSKHKTHKRKSDSSSSEDERPRKKSRKSDDEERHKARRVVDSDSEVEVKKESKHKSRKHKSEHREKKVREVSPEVEEQQKSSKSKERYKESSSREKHKSSSSSSSSSNNNNNNSSSNKKEDSRKSEEHKKSKDKEKKSKHREKERERSEDKLKSSKSKSSSVSIPNNGIDSGSGASFAEALGMCEPSSSKNSSSSAKKKSSSSEKKEKSLPNATEEVVPKLLKEPTLDPIDINLSSLLPPITPNYRPLSNYISSEPQQKKFLSESEALSNIISSKNQRTKVYSGNKVIYGKVPSLFDLCTRVLQDNIDALEFTGGVPYIVLKPILEKANPDQLHNMEHYNPYLIEDTDELWHLHCQKDFRNKKREELETWREMYMRCLDERAAKLKALTANIKQSQDKSLPVRMTKLAYVDAVAKPPRNIARKQAKNGTAFDVRKPAMTPTARLNSLATAGEAGKVAVPNPGSRAAERSSSSHAVKPKKAPLMLKSISSFKNRFKR